MKKARLFLLLSSFFLLSACGGSGTIGGDGNNYNPGGNGGLPFINPSQNTNPGTSTSLSGKNYTYNAGGGYTYGLSFSGNQFTLSMSSGNNVVTYYGTYSVNGSTVTMNGTSSTYNGQSSSQTFTITGTISGSSIRLEMGQGGYVTLSEGGSSYNPTPSISPSTQSLTNKSFSTTQSGYTYTLSFQTTTFTISMSYATATGNYTLNGSNLSLTLTSSTVNGQTYSDSGTIHGTYSGNTITLNMADGSGTLVFTQI